MKSFEIISKISKEKLYKNPKLNNLFANNEKKIIDKLNNKLKQKINQQKESNL